MAWLVGISLLRITKNLWKPSMGCPPPQLEIVFKDLEFSINQSVLVRGITFDVKGLCNLEMETNDDVMRSVRSLFSLKGRTVNGLCISGSVLINGEILSCSEFGLLLNRYILFDRKERVESILMQINPKTTNNLLDTFPQLREKRMGSLTIEETRVVDVLVSIAARPPFVFIENIECRSRNKCLRLLKEYVRESGKVVLVASKYNKIFENTVMVCDSKIFTLFSSKAQEYTESPNCFAFQKSLIFYQTKPIPLPYIPKAYNYKKHFEAQKCENLVALHVRDKKHSVPMHDFFRVNFSQAFLLAARKYTLIFSDYKNNSNIFNGIKPFLVGVCSLQLIKVFLKMACVEHYEILMEACISFKGLSFVLASVVYILLSLMLPAILTNDFGEEHQGFVYITKLFKFIFNGSYSPFEIKVIVGFLFLSVFTNTVSVLEEERNFFEWYGCVLFTPATYLISILFYLIFSQFVTFYLIIRILGFPHPSLVQWSALSASFFFMSIRSKRLREFLVTCFLSLFLLPLVAQRFRVFRCLHCVLCYLFPPLFAGSSFDTPGSLLRHWVLLFAFNLATFFLSVVRLSQPWCNS